MQTTDHSTVPAGSSHSRSLDVADSKHAELLPTAVVKLNAELVPLWQSNTSASVVQPQTDLQRITSLRRRFSQSRSHSSVSFEEPVSKCERTAFSSILPATFVPIQSSQVTTGASMSSMVSGAKLKVPTCLDQFALLQRDVCDTTNVFSFSAKSTTTSMKSSPSTTVQERAPFAVSHPITYQLSLAVNKVRDAGPASAGNVECRLTDCTLRRRVPSYAVLNKTLSNYSTWTPSESESSRSIGEQPMPVSVAMSCYSMKQNRHSPMEYKHCMIDTRSILTHSSYWQYKNKMRVMQCMPSQISATVQAPTHFSQGAVSPAALPTTAANTSGSVATTPEASKPHIVTLPAPPRALAAAPVDNNTRPTVITRDQQLNKKKLHRSQSTPNAGVDLQSKVMCTRLVAVRVELAEIDIHMLFCS